MVRFIVVLTAFLFLWGSGGGAEAVTADYPTGVLIAKKDKEKREKDLEEKEKRLEAWEKELQAKEEELKKKEENLTKRENRLKQKTRSRGQIRGGGATGPQTPSASGAGFGPKTSTPPRTNP